MKNLLLFIFCVLISGTAFGQTTLNKGDIAIVAYSTPDDAFAFATFVDLTVGTEIYFTDEEADGDMTISLNEGHILYTASSPVSAGTVLTFTSVGGDWSTASASFAPGNSGDGLIAYQGTSVGNVTTFLHAVGEDAGDIGSFPANTLSASDYLLFGSDDGNYTGTTSGTAAALFTAINTLSNWTTGGSLSLSPPALFTVASAGGPLVKFDAVTSTQTETNMSFNVSIPVTLSNYSADVTVEATVTGGTAEMGDYSFTQNTLTFTADGTQNITLDINPDAGFDDETIEITITETTMPSTGITVSPDVHTITVTDDEIPGTYTLGAISGNTTEAGGTADFTVVLDVQPVTDVVLDVSSADTDENTVSPATLTFTNANWNVAQTVTVTGVDDVMSDGDQTTTITVAVNDGSSDAIYAGLSETIDVVNEDNECSITNIIAVATCNGDDADVVVTWTATNLTGLIEVDINGNGYQPMLSGATYTLTGPTTAATGLVVTVRDDIDNTCMGTTTVDIPTCPVVIPSVIITEVADPSDNTSKRMVEVCNRGASSVDITGWKLNGDFNGNTDVDFTVDVNGNISLAAGECYVFANNNFPAGDLSACAGSTLSGNISTNGNESFWLNNGTQDVDFYDGQTLNFADSKATRNGSISTPNASFTPSEWTVTAATGADVTPCSDASLPVELLSFTATPSQNTVALTWATATEENNAYFEVQSSVDGRNFETIGQVEGAGTTYETQEYSFIDENPASGVNYYRLRQVDFDAAFEYHKVISVLMNGNDVEAQIYPNPTRGELNVVLPTTNESEIQVIDLTGKILRTVNAANDGITTLDVADLPNGQYMIRIINGQSISTSLFVKTK